MDKLLVTGGTGFIGSHLAEFSLKQGHVVNVLGLTETEADKANASFLKSLGATIYAGSITDIDLCRRALDGVSHVYHLAVAMREAGVTDDYYKQVNLEGTRALLDVAETSGVERLIYCGTIGIFGHRFDGVANEDTQKAPGNIYEETKLAAEQLTLDFGRAQKLDTMSLRPADVYGPRDQRLLKLFRAVEKGRFPLFGEGSGRRHMVYVSDVVSAFERATVTDSGLGQAFIIAGPEVCTLAEFIELIRVATGSTRSGIQLPLAPMMALAGLVEDTCARIKLTPPIYRRRMDFFTSDCAFDTSRARKQLQWQPTVSLRNGIELTAASIR